VAILDIDVHHGNGTQDIFYEESEVFFCSLHEDPRMQYPGTGFADERGRGEGKGATLNLPMVSGTEGRAYLCECSETALPAIRAHRPQMLLLSAGFDSHLADPLGGLRLVEGDFRVLGHLLGETVRELSVPALLVLEGGYDPLCFHEGLRPFLQGWTSSV
jgi:acetoin utilization deacetylase AcuC-like enzyme